jgi:hypothetical protein
MKFDVNKIITESIMEADQFNDGNIGASPMWTKKSIAKPSEQDADKFNDGNIGASPMWTKKSIAKPSEQDADAETEATTRAARAERGNEDLAEKEKAAQDAADATTRAARAERGREALDDKEQADKENSVAGHFSKSFKKLKTGVEDEATKVGHKAADWVGNLDPGHTGIAAASGIAAGLGALALRKRLKKVK